MPVPPGRRGHHEGRDRRAVHERELPHALAGLDRKARGRARGVEVRAQVPFEQQKEVVVRVVPCQQSLAGAERAQPAPAQDCRELLARHPGEQRVIGQGGAGAVGGHHGLDASPSRHLASIVSRFLPSSRA